MAPQKRNIKSKTKSVKPHILSPLISYAIALRWHLFQVVFIVPMFVFLFLVSSSSEIYAGQEMPYPYIDTHDSFAGYYMAARFAENTSNIKKSTELFTSVLAKSDNNTDLLGRGYKIMLFAGEIDKAMNIAHNYVAKGDKISASTRATLAHILLAIEKIKKQDFAQANNILSPLYANKEKSENDINMVAVPLLLAWTKASMGEFEEAHWIIDDVGGGKDITDFLRYQKAIMYSIDGNNKKAKEEFDTIVENGLQPMRVVLSATKFYNHIGETAKSREILEGFSKKHPSYVIHAEHTKYNSNLSVKDRSLQAMAEILLELGGVFYANGLTEKPIRYLRLALYLDSDLDYGRMLLASLLEKNNYYEEAGQLYSSISVNSPFYHKASIAKAINLNRLGDTNSAKEALINLAQNSTSYNAFLHLGDILLGKNHYAEAIDAYSSAINRMGDLSKKSWSIFYARGIAYEKVGRWVSAERDFKKALELHPSQPDVLNYLAYSWLMKDINFMKAKDMLEVALQLRPNDAHIVDSYGWALFKSGDFEGATDYLEAANLKIPYDPVTNDHLGDVYWRVGRKLEAKYQWQRALTFNPDDEDAIKIRHKVAEGLPAGETVPVALNKMSESM